MIPLIAILIVALIVVTILLIRQYRIKPVAAQLGDRRIEYSSQWFNKETPLWLPKGTVRAILVLIAMVAVVYPIFKLVTLGGSLDPAVKEIMLVLVGGLIGLVKDYITQRDSNGNGATPT